MPPWLPEKVAAPLPAADRSPLVRRKSALVELASDRGRLGALVLALLGSVVLYRVRLITEPVWLLSAEWVPAFGLGLALWWSVRNWRRDRGAAPLIQSRAIVVLSSLWLLLPLLANLIQRQAGFGAPPELLSLAVLGQLGILLAEVPGHRRAAALSVVCSGFLVLLTVFVADRNSEVWIGMTWVVLCLWWLVANHWERMTTAQARQIDRSGRLRPLSMAAGLLLVLGGSLLASGRMREALLSGFEWMPTSGGTSWQDRTATRGVGDGDLIRAARQQAQAFGAVDSDVFIESKTPSLFDVMGETLGKPMLRKRIEKAISLDADRLLAPDQRPAESRTASTSFSTARERPERKANPRDLDGAALMRWIGPCGSSLATHHYDRFDGMEWHDSLNTRLPAAHPETIVAGDETWFCRPGQLSRIEEGTAEVPFEGTLKCGLKFLRFRSPRVPTLPGLELWHLPDVNRSDFFVVHGDDCLGLDGREHIPDYTEIRMLNRRISLDQLREYASVSKRDDARSMLPRSRGVAMAQRLAREWTAGSSSGWDQIETVINRLRSDFEFDRGQVCGLTESGALQAVPETVASLPEAVANGSGGIDSEAVDAQDPLAYFLEHRSGSDVLFATAAAVMLRELGYETRFVTGFYVDPTRSQLLAGETPIHAEDAHAWLEFKVGAHGWVPLEPTPGFAIPPFQRSLLSSLWAALPWISGSLAGLVATSLLLWRLRSILFELLVTGTTPLLGWLEPRAQMRWLLRILDVRARLAGLSRPRHLTPALFYLPRLGQNPAVRSAQAVSELFRTADRQCYSQQPTVWTVEQSALVRLLWRKGRLRKP